MQKYLRIIACFLLIISTRVAFAESGFTVIQKPLPDWVVVKMKRHSWREGCPVPLKDLTYLYLNHWGFDGKVHDGRLVVHKQVADDIAVIFETLFKERFPIEKIRLIDEYGGSDNASMADNNTSAFNCRDVTGKPGVFSKHSYGLAIDINPLINPYLVSGKILPPKGIKYTDRSKKKKGMIMKGDIVYQSFINHGWIWGGNWHKVKDYQHFQITLNKFPSIKLE